MKVIKLGVLMVYLGISDRLIQIFSFLYLVLLIKNVFLFFTPTTQGKIEMLDVSPNHTNIAEIISFLIVIVDKTIHR